jgi:hypothetical protein
MTWGLTLGLLAGLLLQLWEIRYRERISSMLFGTAFSDPRRFLAVAGSSSRARLWIGIGAALWAVLLGSWIAFGVRFVLLG